MPSLRLLRCIHSGFHQLCEESRVDALARLYSFFSRVGVLDELKDRFASFIVVCAVTLLPSRMWRRSYCCQRD